MNYVFPMEWPLPTDYLTELGRVSVLFGALESSVNLAISKLSGYEGLLDWRSAVVNAHANFKQRLDILETLCHELHDELPYQHLNSYRNVVKKIKHVQEKRNKYMHNSLTYDQSLNEVNAVSLSARGQMKPRSEKVSIEEMRELSANIHIALLDLHELITQTKHAPIWERVT